MTGGERMIYSRGLRKKAIIRRLLIIWFSSVFTGVLLGILLGYIIF